MPIGFSLGGLRDPRLRHLFYYAGEQDFGGRYFCFPARFLFGHTLFSEQTRSNPVPP
jgi:hypothetical protein